MALLAAACSTTGPVPGGDAAAEASIPFVSSNGISEWRRAGEGMLYIRSISGEWYIARTMNICSALDSALSLGFLTSPTGQLDRFGTILAEEQRCPIASLVRSGPPPEASSETTVSRSPQ
jgi:hypothetical protein